MLAHSTQLNSNRLTVASNNTHRWKIWHDDNSKHQRGTLKWLTYIWPSTCVYIVYQLDGGNVNEKNMTKMQVQGKWKLKKKKKRVTLDSCVWFAQIHIFPHMPNLASTPSSMIDWGRLIFVANVLILWKCHATLMAKVSAKLSRTFVTSFLVYDLTELGAWIRSYIPLFSILT